MPQQKRNWDKLVKEIEEEEKKNPERDADVFKTVISWLFECFIVHQLNMFLSVPNQLFDGADDDAKRAMEKSLQESNGTASV